MVWKLPAAMAGLTSTLRVESRCRLDPEPGSARSNATMQHRRSIASSGARHDLSAAGASVFDTYSLRLPVLAHEQRLRDPPEGDAQDLRFDLRPLDFVVVVAGGCWFASRPVQTRYVHVADLLGVGLLVVIVGSAVVGIARAVRRQRAARRDR